MTLEIQTDKTDIANQFNNYFTSLLHKILLMLGVKSIITT